MHDKLKQSIVMIRCGEKQGTGFFISSDKIITATHVIDFYLSDHEPIVIESLNIFEQNVFAYISDSDKSKNQYPVVVLTVDKKVPSYPLQFTKDYKIQSRDKYETFGYPEFKLNEGLWLSGDIIWDWTGKNIVDSNLTLSVQGNIPDLKGLSGAPVIIDEMVIGVVLRETNPNNQVVTLEAISFECFATLILDCYTVENRHKNSMREKILKENPSVSKYLPKKVVPEKAMNHVFHFESKDLIDVIKTEKRVALLGDAGTGKTTELNRIAYHFLAKDSSLFPYLFSLSKYVGESIDFLLPDFFKRIPCKERLLILDGLDEVEDKNFNTAIRQIELFAEHYPNTTILISCRSNFFNSESESLIGTLKHFRSYLLVDLSFNQINDYIHEQLGRKASEFEDSINRNQLDELLGIPFYLVNLVEIFQKTGQIPNTKAEVYNMLLQSRMKLDINHYRTTALLPRSETSIYNSLEKIGLAMTVMGRKYISANELEKLEPDQITRGLICYGTTFKKVSYQGESFWGFEHKNFQEYLAARVLLSQPFDTVRKLVAFEPDYQKIKPTWINAVSFLISMSTDRDLIDWILEMEPELVVKVEPDKVDKLKRIEIFKNIFHNHKMKNIWINGSKFNLNELARFGESDDIVKFLMREVENNEDYSKYNAIRLLGRLKIHRFTLKKCVCHVLTQVVLQHDRNIPSVVSNALISLADLNLNKGENVNPIVTAIRCLEQDQVRYGLYYFLLNSDRVDENVDVLLDGIEFVEFKRNCGQVKTRCLDEKYFLTECLKKVSSPNAVTGIVEYFKCNYDAIDDFKAIFAQLAINASKIHRSNQGIFQSILELVLVMKKNGFLQLQHMEILSFFDITKTRFTAFYELLSTGFSDLELLAMLSDEESVIFVIDNYKKIGWDESKLKWFYNCLYSYNKETYPKFNSYIKEKGIIQSNLNYDDLQKKNLQFDFDILFDKKGFIKEISRLFSESSNTEMDRDTLFKLKINNNVLSETVFYFLLKLCPTNYANVEKKVNEIWEDFTLCEIFDKMQKSDHINISYEQVKYLENWCNINLANVNFKTDFEKCSNGYAIPQLLWFFLRKLKLTYPENILLDLLSFDWFEDGKYVGLEYLEDYLNEDQMTERVLENLHQGIRFYPILKNHIDYCRRHKIPEVLPYAYREVKNPSQEKDIRKVALITIFEFDEPIEIIEDLLLIVTDDFKWEIVNWLTKKNSLKVEDYLVSILKTGSEEEKKRAANRLMEMQNIHGLKYFVKWQKNQGAFSRRFDESFLTWFYTQNAVPYLMLLLKYCLKKNLNEDIHLDELFYKVQESLTIIALHSEDNYQKVKYYIKRFIKKYWNKYTYVNHLYAFLDRLEQRYYIGKIGKIEIDEVIILLNSILP